MEKEKGQPTNFADCYVLTNERTATFVHSFLETFLPNRQAYSNSFEVPQFSESPTHLFSSTPELITYLETNKEETHGIYWYNTESTELQGAMCLFYEDGSLVVGLCCRTLYPDTSIEERYTKRLLQFCKSQKACILYEEPAPRSLATFLSKPSFTL